MDLALAVGLLHAAAFALGYFLSRGLNFDEKTARTVSIETGEYCQKNAPISAAPRSSLCVLSMKRKAQKADCHCPYRDAKRCPGLPAGTEAFCGPYGGRPLGCQRGFHGRGWLSFGCVLAEQACQGSAMNFCDVISVLSG